MQTNKKSLGFTIVELLVVIVVIGILAGITIVSYTGITQRAKTTKSQSNAVSVKKVIEIMATENNSLYPVTAASITAYSASATSVIKLPAGVNVITGQSGANGTTFTTPATVPISATNGETDITYSCLATVVAGPCLTTGGRLTYWDFGTSQQVVMYVGQGSPTGVYFNPAS